MEEPEESEEPIEPEEPEESAEPEQEEPVQPEEPEEPLEPEEPEEPLEPEEPEESHVVKVDGKQVGCFACQMTLRTVVSMLGTGGDLALKPFLKKKCEGIDEGKEAERELCSKFTGSFFDDLVSMVLAILEPKIFCELVTACDS